MKIVTGNDLKTGDVIWWTGSGWSRSLADAKDAGEGAEAIIARESAAQNVFDGYVVDGEMTDTGPRPAHIKERMRALGPSVRLDLGVQAKGPVHVSL